MNPFLKIFRLTFLLAAAGGLSASGVAQILLSGGTYSQNFNSLATNGSNIAWVDDSTLPGWFATKLPGAAGIIEYNASRGTDTSGSFYSFGSLASMERALGSLCSGSITVIAYGVCFTNDTAFAQTNITISYTGEQWRNANGSGAETNVLSFSYRVGRDITFYSSDANDVTTWTAVNALNFNSPLVGGSGTALDGNAAANRQIFTNIILSGVVLQPGEGIFLRWRDVDNSGGDAGMAIDNLTVSFTATAPSTNTPEDFSASGAFTLMTYNVKGNGTTDWSTNAPQVQAIGRELVYLKPDIITFNEIPLTNTYQMANWVIAYLPGYFLATNSGSDGFIRSVIASRFPITRSSKWLDGADLKPFGYTNTSSASADNFTRDLFEAQIAMPNWPLPLHVFTTHLKSDSGTTYTDAAAKRAAEAAAITNFFATNFFTLYPAHPYTLSGDFNEGDTNAVAIQRLAGSSLHLHLTNPTNSATGSINTYSSSSPGDRIDYILSCDLLASNLISGQVFRTDKLNSLPPGLQKFDSTNASDHLPVLMIFKNPFNTPFKLLSIARTNQNLTLAWESQNNRTFNIEASSNLSAWTPWATNLQSATNAPFVFATNVPPDGLKFFRVYRVP